MKHFLILTILINGFLNAQEASIKHLSVNSKLDHFSPHVYNERVYLTYSAPNKKSRSAKDASGYIYTIYEGNLDANGEIKDVQPIKKSKNSNFSMSSAIVTKDGKYMYFTTSSKKLGQNKLKGYKTYNLQLQRAEYIEGKGWTNFTILPFCDVDHNFAHPALSPDEKSLYFVSNLKGTKGKSDIFKVSINAHQSYGKPKRLDTNANSPRSELFPYVSADNVLYFSSDRRGGLGSYDIYSFDLKSNNEKEEAIRLPEPINSRSEDFSFFLKKDLKTGYFTSRRSKGAGNDDIYYFELK